MKKATYTPGPWAIDDMHVFVPNQDGTSKGSIAHVYDIHPEDLEGFGGYNGRLIAAAPDMLDKLRDALCELDKWREFSPDDTDLHNLTGDIRQVIFNATGE